MDQFLHFLLDVTRLRFQDIMLQKNFLVRLFSLNNMDNLIYIASGC